MQDFHLIHRATIGFLTAVALFVPYLGRALAPVFHWRIWAFFFTTLVVFASGKNLLRATMDWRLAVSSLPFFLACVAAASAPQFHAAFQPQLFGLDYYVGKLGRMVQSSPSLLILGLCASALRADRFFRSGFVAGVILVGIVAGIQSVIFREYLIYRTVQDITDLIDSELFSSISLSLIFSANVIVAFSFRSEKTWLKVTLVLWVVFCLAAIIVLRQRTHAAFCVIFMVLWALRGIKQIFLIGVAITGLLTVTAVFGEAIFSDAILVYWTPVALESAGRYRTQLLEECLISLFNTPEGHGLGGFSLYYSNLYPHNMFAEAAFELGVVGVLTLALAIGLPIIRVLRTGVRGKIGDNAMYVALFVFMVIQGLKSGEMVTMVPFILAFAFLLPKPGEGQAELNDDNSFATTPHIENSNLRLPL